MQQETLEQASEGARGVGVLITRADDLSKAMNQSLQLSVRAGAQRVGRLNGHHGSMDVV